MNFFNKLICLSLFFVLTGASWLDLDSTVDYSLNQKIDVMGLDGEPLVYKTGSNLQFIDSTKLILNAWLYRFELSDCSTPERTSDLELLTDMNSDYEYGVLIEENCLINIFLVTEDLSKEAIVSPKQ
ncbi:MAG: hypothetical protein COW01_02875 [Bdellovibrionales bacterium CG12_big_fil_rev_8_21_14_0_65_38_15]|nr:MAG: hypothetical protein COW79_08540 [Bdellovibrionales bacterium CG22_combo_CG10-13_8_21_14_all_38_13]PIQ57034.1 MAG: hypothetical protein COW01_02875 [Bdellovibrionales bacterium CG12_big_fil_rev_8_21_14_0_65_38_15]PIR29004.1 MAG: hypothetical protein COV38_12245 [Bdellovibrionales bacterium CG11_big_fil_rev_8_21_14_0_20_38_13]